MAGSPITLDFLAAQQQRILDELATVRTQMTTLQTDVSLIKDDIGVLSAMAQRQDRATKALLELVNTLAQQQNRFEERLRRIEEAQQE